MNHLNKNCNQIEHSIKNKNKDTFFHRYMNTCLFDSFVVFYIVDKVFLKIFRSLSYTEVKVNIFVSSKKSMSSAM